LLLSSGRLKRFELVVSFATVQLSISIEPPPPPPPKNKRKDSKNKNKRSRRFFGFFILFYVHRHTANAARLAEMCDVIWATKRFKKKTFSEWNSVVRYPRRRRRKFNK
jgi:hypothetical protein